MKTCADLLGDALGSETVLIADAPFALVIVRGPDAGDFLQRLCSQDVVSMPVGAARPAAFLTAKGKLESLTWVGRLEDRWVIESQGHERDKVAALLDRYHFAEKLALEMPAGLRCTMVLGPEAWDGGLAGGRVHEDGDACDLTGEGRGLRWRRWHAPGVPAAASRWPRVGHEAWHLRRVAAGLPWMGLDADASTLVMEAGVDDHISTTKGCYTGQEIVARIHTYGHVNRRLCRLEIDGTGDVAPGTGVEDEDGMAVGRALSVVPVPGAARRLGLGYLPGEFCTPGATLRLAGGAAVRVVG